MKDFNNERHREMSAVLQSTIILLKWNGLAHLENK